MTRDRCRPTVAVVYGGLVAGALLLSDDSGGVASTLGPWLVLVPLVFLGRLLTWPNLIAGAAMGLAVLLPSVTSVGRIALAAALALRLESLDRARPPSAFGLAFFVVGALLVRLLKTSDLWGPTWGVLGAATAVLLAGDEMLVLTRPGRSLGRGALIAVAGVVATVWLHEARSSSSSATVAQVAPP